MTLTIRATALRDFSDCRRSWLLSESWQVKKPIGALWLGEMVHAGLEGYYQSISAGDQVNKMISTYNAAVEKSYEYLEEKFPETWSLSSQEFYNLEDLGRGMLQNYALFDAISPIEGKILHVEQRLHQTIGRGVVLSGQIDLLVERNDGIWIIDHKTSSSGLNSAALDVDEQLTAYSWLVWKATGVVPRGVIFNVLMKSLPEPPRILKSGALSQDVSQKTTYDLYVTKIEELGLNQEDYLSYLNILKGRGWQGFFVREGSTRNLEELKSFERRALSKARDIQNIIRYPQEFAYPSPSIYRCGYCQFLGVCKAIDDGGDYQAMLESMFQPSSY